MQFRRSGSESAQKSRFLSSKVENPKQPDLPSPTRSRRYQNVQEKVLHFISKPRLTISPVLSFWEMNMKFPSCRLFLMNPVQLHTLRCRTGPYAPKASHCHAKSALNLPRYGLICVSLTYLNWFSPKLEDSCCGDTWQVLRKRRSKFNRLNVFLLEQQRLAPFYPWQPLCLHTFMLKGMFSSLPFQQGEQKYLPHTSGLTNKTSWQCYFVDWL